MDGEHGGIVMFVKQVIICDKVVVKAQFDSLEIGAISVSTNSGNFLIIACYRSPTYNNKLTPDEIINFNII